MRPKLSENFYEDEIRCRCGACNKLQLHPGFIEQLQAIRSEFGQSMHVTSGCRCHRYNLDIGGHARSLHVCDVPSHIGQLGTLAVDIAAVDGNYRGGLFQVAWKRGWSIGWNAKRGFLHLDRRDWLGMKQTSFDY
jgi:hypothetical protein